MNSVTMCSHSASGLKSVCPSPALAKIYNVRLDGFTRYYIMYRQAGQSNLVVINLLLRVSLQCFSPPLPTVGPPRHSPGTPRNHWHPHSMEK